MAELPPLAVQVKGYMPHALEGAIFCGHLMTDLDSIAGAIGASELYGSEDMHMHACLHLHVLR